MKYISNIENFLNVQKLFMGVRHQDVNVYSVVDAVDAVEAISAVVAAVVAVVKNGPPSSPLPKLGIN